MDDKWVTLLVVGVFVLFFVGMGGALYAQEENVQPDDEAVAGYTFEEVFVGLLYGALGLATLACLAIGGSAMLMAGRIAVSRPIDAAEVRDADGAVEVQGTAQPVGDTFAAPFSGRASLATTAKKLRKRRATGNGGMDVSWTTTSSSERAVPFYVTDDSGRVAVDPDGASLSLAEHTEEKRRDTDYKYANKEGRLQPDGTVHVYGHRIEADSPEEAPGDDAVYVGDGGGTFKISDTTQFRTALRSAIRGLAYLAGAAVFVLLGWQAAPTLL